jgi:hypothetical protein
MALVLEISKTAIKADALSIGQSSFIAAFVIVVANARPVTGPSVKNT